ENGPTVISIAVPIYDDEHNIIASLGASEIANNISDKTTQEILQFLQSCVEEIQLSMHGELACQ
ncbi:MAG: hypothetical protein HRU15_15660, partial [Planctomycetes bacterium]|nr:hypothetical protein [Planctomycetota bacterium]